MLYMFIFDKLMRSTYMFCKKQHPYQGNAEETDGMELMWVHKCPLIHSNPFLSWVN